MSIKSMEEQLLSIYNQTQNKTEAARKVAALNGMPYSDSFRRICAMTINKALKKQSGLLDGSAKDLEVGAEKWEEDNSKGTGYYESVVNKPVKTLEDALKVANVDLSVWEVERWICNSWGVTSFKDNPKGTYRTNYQIKIWLRRKELTVEELVEEIMWPALEDYTPMPIKRVGGNTQTGVVSFSDFHIGADIKNLLRSPDFDIHILLNYLHKATEIINAQHFSKVYVNLLGDFFESLSGMNHENTFKSLGTGMWGANVMIVANEILGRHFLSKINNLVEINMVSGNHDRMTASNKLDNTGEGGKVLWYMLQKDFPNVPINYHNSVLSREIDGINYLLTHGDKGYSKRDFSKFVLDYGSTDIYNLVLEGHLHSRFTKKVVSYGKKVYGDLEVVHHDDLNYRKVIVAPLFTGNWFSESLGYGSSAGFLITQNNGAGRPNVHDYSL